MKKSIYLMWAMLLMSLPTFAQIGGIEEVNFPFVVGGDFLNRIPI